MRFVILRRKAPLKYGKALTIVLSLAFGIGIFTTFSAFLGINPIFILESIATTFVFPGIIKDFLILTLLGYALLIAFRGSLWNIGAEGQVHMAYLIMVYITVILFYTREKTISLYSSIGIIFLSFMCAIMAGALWGGLAGVIKAYAKIDEVPVTLILNYIAYFIGDILVYGPFRGKYVYGYVRTDILPEPYRIDLRIHIFTTGNPIVDTLLGFIREFITYLVWLIGLLLVIVFVYWLFSKTTIGLRIKILGSNPEYLTTLGYDVNKLTVITFMISGAIAGFTAALYYHGSLLRLGYPLEYQTEGYGYLAVLVTWLSHLDVILVPVSAYIVSSLIIGCQRASALPGVREAFEEMGLGGGEIAFRLLMFGSILLSYSILRFIQEYELRVIRE